MDIVNAQRIYTAQTILVTAESKMTDQQSDIKENRNGLFVVVGHNFCREDLPIVGAQYNRVDLITGMST